MCLFEMCRTETKFSKIHLKINDTLSLLVTITYEESLFSPFTFIALKYANNIELVRVLQSSVEGL